MDCSADAGGDGDGFTLENNWRAKECTKLNCKARRGLVIREVRLQESELIAAKTGDDVSSWAPKESDVWSRWARASSI